MKTLLNKYQQILNHPLDDADINQILIYLEQNQIKKLDFEYGKTILNICLEYCQQREDYFKCAAIKKFIEETEKYA